VETPQWRSKLSPIFSETGEEAGRSCENQIPSVFYCRDFFEGWRKGIGGGRKTKSKGQGHTSEPEPNTAFWPTPMSQGYYSRPGWYSYPESCNMSTPMVNMKHYQHTQQPRPVTHISHTMHQQSECQKMVYDHAQGLQPDVNNQPLCFPPMGNVQHDHEHNWHVASNCAPHMTGMEQHLVLQHRDAYEMQTYIHMPARFGAAVSARNEHQQWLAAPRGFKVTQKVWPAGMECATQSEFTSRAPMLAHKLPVLAVRCVPTARLPVLASERITTGSTATSHALHPTSLPVHVDQHLPRAENAAQLQHPSHQAAGQWVQKIADDDAFDGLHMSVDSAEGQNSGEGTLRDLCWTHHDGADGLQMLARCAGTSQASRQTATPAQITQHVQMQTFRSAAKVLRPCASCKMRDTPKWRAKGTLCNKCGLRAKRRSRPEYQKEAREDADARKRRFEAAAAVMATTPWRSVRKSASTRLSSGSSTQPQRCLACDSADTAKWRWGGLLCNSCVLGAKRLPGK
jgi:hypothetical protein